MKHKPVVFLRDSKTGRRISQQTANRKPRSTWEREIVYRPSPKKG